MKITRDVITDLLPLYESGEASPDSRSLIEDYFQQDPDFAHLVQSGSTQSLPPNSPAALPRELEMQTLYKTKNLLRRRTWLLSFAILFSLWPFSFTFDSHGLYWAWAQTPLAALVFMVIAIFLWIMYFRTVRRIQNSGL
jgi:hypothetical protein